MSDDGQAGIPEHWEVKKLKKLSVVKKGASTRPNADPQTPQAPFVAHRHININIVFTMRNVFLILMIFPVFVFAQNPPEILWTEFFGEEYSDVIDCVIETSDVNLLMSGYKKITQTDCYDVYLIKTNTDGIIEWEHCLIRQRLLRLLTDAGYPGTRISTTHDFDLLVSYLLTNRIRIMSKLKSYAHGDLMCHT